MTLVKKCNFSTTKFSRVIIFNEPANYIVLREQSATVQAACTFLFKENEHLFLK